MKYLRRMGVFTIIASLGFFTACVSTPLDYEICDTPNCAPDRDIGIEYETE